MSATKRAILIGSRTGVLEGTENDVEMMTGVLKKYGFELQCCLGSNATRDGVLAAWQELISSSSADDAVVIYYSGHGALADYDEPDEREDHHQKKSEKYILPTDFELSTDDDFRGILDIEMSYMLRNTTERTRNVTIILDCCFSSRMVRGPNGIKLVSKCWPTDEKYNISKHVERLRRDGKLQGNLFIEGNPDAVRIAAASPTEKAYEYINQKGQAVGLLTETLAEALNETFGKEVSWRTTLLRVCEIVQTKFLEPEYLQHPQAEGPDTRIPFSTKQMLSGAKFIKMENGEAIIDAGSVAGVREADIYAIMPHGSERIDSESQIAKAKVTQTSGFKSLAYLTFATPEKSIPPEGALAFLETRAPNKWPVSFPGDFHALRQQIQKSEFLRSHDAATEESPPLVQFLQEGDKILVRSGLGTTFFRQQAAASDTASLQNLVEAAVFSAENLALAQNILTCRGGIQEEALEHGIDVEFGLVSEGKKGRILSEDGDAGAIIITAGERVFISLHNKGDTTTFMSVLDVNAAGDISLVSRSNPRGIELKPDKRHVLGESLSGLRGLQLSWPKKVPEEETLVEETLVIVLTNSTVDLRPLTNQRQSNSESRGSIARFLERNTRGDGICYDVHHIPFLLRSVL